MSTHHTFASCKEQASSINATRVISNNTSKDLTLSFFLDGVNGINIYISSGKSDSTQEFCVIERGRLQRCIIESSLNVDSVQINFEGGKRLTYCEADQSCNLINGKNIMSFNIENPSQNQGFIEVSDNVFVFTIEESDYQLAKPL